MAPRANSLVVPLQALHSRDNLQLEYTDCLLDKNRLRKRIAELQANLEQLQRELEREQDRSREQMQQSSSCLNCVRSIETRGSVSLFHTATELHYHCLHRHHPSPTSHCAARTSAMAPAAPWAWNSDLRWKTIVCCCGRSSMAFTLKSAFWFNQATSIKNRKKNKTTKWAFFCFTDICSFI